MKKTLFAALFSLFLSVSCFAGNTEANSAYYIDDNAVESVFENGSMLSTMPVEMAAEANGLTGPMFTAQKNEWVAFALAWVVGYLGIHRWYLGTSTGTKIGYCLTLGGCGIVAFIDWIVLLIGAINKDISQYEDNPSFFMWL